MPKGDNCWSLLDELSKALEPTWHEVRTAGRVRRHTDILRDIARELSNDPDRPDRPKTAAEARDRFEDYLEFLSVTTPRSGLAAATGAFVDDLIDRYDRYSDHLFHCFDDHRIPATTNDLEGFFGASKHALRRGLGCGSTTNSVVSNLSAEALVAYHQMQQPGALAELANLTSSQNDFLEARAMINRGEAPGIRQRSMVRHLDRHVNRLRQRWFGPDPPSDANA
jgi:hypothetical protein